MFFSVTFSPKGRLLASDSEDKTICIWDVATGALTQTLQTGSSCRSVAFSPTGRLLASSSIEIWDLETSTAIQTLAVHSDKVSSVAFSPDGCVLASGSVNSTLRLWDLAMGDNMRESFLSKIWSLAYSPDGRLLASLSNNGIGLWDPATGALIRVLKNHPTDFESISFSPDGHTLASGLANGYICLWSPATGILRQILKGHSTKQVWAVAFSSSGRLLASISGSKTVYLWDTEVGHALYTLRCHLISAGSVSFSPDNHLLATSDGTTVYIWNPATGALLHTLAKDLRSPYRFDSRSVLLSCSGRLLAYDSKHRIVRLWNPAMSSPIQTLEDHSDDGRSTCFNDFHVHNDLDTEYSCAIPASRSPHMCLDTSIERGQWIKVKGERKLWLPHESRPTSLLPFTLLHTFKVYDNTVALGHQSGKVSFIVVT
ncbi:hypothetical protein N7493_002251 [Penicillium malachiteum]|uniref:Vegetative incompatibility protein HET-E-1 n=1 Tax=Penicillium malachiteum TaxID=1324776 RepID=A0AAD6MYS9_9EURO|nr:hypothetical protein N7493_002251 [Penicillium malachiteum]